MARGENKHSWEKMKQLRKVPVA